MVGNSLRHTLELFCEKAEKLRNSTFVKQLKGSRPTFEWTTADNRIEYSGPDAEAVEAFVLTLRFFIQDDEPTSLHNLSKIQIGSRLSAAWHKTFKETRDLLDSFLDQYPLIRTSNRNAGPLTRRDILYMFVYGDLSHASTKQRATLSAFTQHPAARAMLWTQFQDIVYSIQVAVREIESVTRAELAL